MNDLIAEILDDLFAKHNKRPPAADGSPGLWIARPLRTYYMQLADSKYIAC